MGLGGGEVSTGFSAGTELSIDPLSNFPVRWAGRTGVPNFGVVRGPPGPSFGPMLLFSDPPSLTSNNCTDIGVFNSGFGIAVRVASLKKRSKTTPWKSTDETKNGLRSRETISNSPQSAEFW
jgi:hypothetical protein